jgi:NAD(P)-dependent dehydrogenase (short-subunit alcohol dehydrogenase family)
MDVANKTSVKKGFEALEQKNEKIDIVICSAGIGGLTPIFDTEDSIDRFEKIVQTNLLGVWYVTYYAANHMKRHHIAGSIIPISSINGANRVRENITGYAASKAGVIQLTKTLTGELSKDNIRINCIAPGLFHTSMTEYKLHSAELREEMAEVIPLHFVAEPSDLDAAILYLASNKASRYVTGTCLTVDGGASWGGHGGK